MQEKCGTKNWDKVEQKIGKMKNTGILVRK